MTIFSTPIKSPMGQSCSSQGFDNDHFCVNCKKNTTKHHKKTSSKPPRPCIKPWILPPNSPPRKVTTYTFLAKKYPHIVASSPQKSISQYIFLAESKNKKGGKIKWRGPKSNLMRQLIHRVSKDDRAVVSKCGGGKIPSIYGTKLSPCEVKERGRVNISIL